MTPEQEKIVKCTTEALRKEYDDIKSWGTTATRDAAALTLKRVAHIFVGKMQAANIPIDEAKFLKEACDGDPGDY